MTKREKIMFACFIAVVVVLAGALATLRRWPW
jgi:hypothetical protein